MKENYYRILEIEKKQAEGKNFDEGGLPEDLSWSVEQREVRGLTTDRWWRGDAGSDGDLEGLTCDQTKHLIKK